jgi:hypothetical protein
MGWVHAGRARRTKIMYEARCSRKFMVRLQSSPDMTLDFKQQLVITVLDKLLIAGLLALAGFGFNRALERFRHALDIDATRRQLTANSQIQFKEKQLAEFYGPIYAFLKRIRPIDDLWNEGQVKEVDDAIIKLIRESNDRIVEIILSKSHLIRGSTIPESHTRFLTHVAVWHAFWDHPNADWSQYGKIRDAQYDRGFEKEVFDTTELLKRELQLLYEQYGIEK